MREERRHSYIFLDFRKNAFSLFNITLTVGLLYIVFVWNIPSAPTFFKIFIMKAIELLSGTFSVCTEMVNSFLSFKSIVYLHVMLHLLICTCWSNFASLKWDHLFPDVWSSCVPFAHRFWLILLIRFCLKSTLPALPACWYLLGRLIPSFDF